ncbi:hypothetical protein FKM82_029122 [Ascaphus truei]
MLNSSHGGITHLQGAGRRSPCHGLGERSSLFWTRPYPLLQHLCQSSDCGQAHGMRRCVVLRMVAASFSLAQFGWAVEGLPGSRGAHLQLCPLVSSWWSLLSQ